LNEDSSLSECLLYYIKEGLTRVGSPEANIPQDIQLVGTHITSEHCIFENSEGIVKLIPSVSSLADFGAYVSPRISYVFSLRFLSQTYFFKFKLDR
jgi:kinesin family protein 1